MAQADPASPLLEGRLLDDYVIVPTLEKPVAVLANKPVAVLADQLEDTA